MTLTGLAVSLNALVILTGFGVLTLSQVPANFHLGLQAVLEFVNCLIPSPLLLPLLRHWWPLKSPAIASIPKSRGGSVP